MGEIFRQERSEAALLEPADARIARLHLYYIARTLCAGRDVLDLRAGDGSGAAILAQVARSVRACISDPAALQPAGQAFGAENLTFDDTLPEAEQFDVVVAFEAIERAADEAQFAAGLHAMLRPGGTLLIGTPDGDHPPASGIIPVGQRRAFRRDTLLALLRRHFRHVAASGQRGLIGSVVLGQSPGGVQVVEHRGLLHAEMTDALKPAALFCLASDEPLTLVDSVFIDSDIAALAEWQARAMQASLQLTALEEERDALVVRCEDQRRDDKQWRHELAVLRVSEAAARTAHMQATTGYAAERQHYLAALVEAQARIDASAAHIRADAARIRTLEDAQAQIEPTQTHAANLETIVAHLHDAAAVTAVHVYNLECTNAHLQDIYAATATHVSNLEGANVHLRDMAVAQDARVGALGAELASLHAKLRDGDLRARQLAAECARLNGELAQSFRRRLARRLGRDNLAERIARVDASTLFDATWYQMHHADVAGSGMAPARHYVVHGAAELRDPGPEFDAGWYAAQHPDLARNGLSALEDYELRGRAAGWQTRTVPESTAEIAPAETLHSTPHAVDQTADVAVADETPVAQGDAFDQDHHHDVEKSDRDGADDELLDETLAHYVPPIATALDDDEPVVSEQDDPQPDETVPEEAVTPAAPNPRVLFISGEAHTPGNDYRCIRYAAAAREAGWSSAWRRLEDTGAVDLIGVEIVVLWRVRYSQHVANINAEIRQAGGTVVFDVDDLMFRPELARNSVIDGIRTTNAGVASTRETFAQVQQAMASADLCTTTTEELAQHMREWQKATYVLPNGFDDASHARARLAVRGRPPAQESDPVRIGYAAGTVTHQKDFLQALTGLVRVMQARPKVVLVLFRVPGISDLVEIDEFEELLPFADRIEWRDYVPLDELPAELARFDISIAPLQLGNPFCEAKSELKYFEAALVDVPTVASATGPYARAIEHGRNGMLAVDAEGWYESVLRLIDDADLRRAMGRAAYVDCLWRFGPRRRAELVGAFLEQVQGSVAGARAFALEVLQARDSATRKQPYRIGLIAATTLHRRDRMGEARVTVIVPCYNYADYIIDALESVRIQTLSMLDLIVIDDASTDPLCVELIVEWVKRHEARFNRVIVLRHNENAGLSAARNTGFHMAETPFVIPLDADNRLRPECCAALLDTLEQSNAAYAYPSIQKFHADDRVFGDERYQPMRLVGGNYIDAMAMIGKWAWAAAGGYDMPRRMGWEDFDLWCRLAELGQRGVHVDRILADYRVHDGSMVEALVEVDNNKQQTVALVESRHDWLRLSSRRPAERV